MTSLWLSQRFISASYLTEFILAPLNFTVWLWKMILPGLSYRSACAVLLFSCLGGPPPTHTHKLQSPQDNPSDPHAFSIPFCDSTSGQGC